MKVIHKEEHEGEDFDFKTCKSGYEVARYHLPHNLADSREVVSCTRAMLTIAVIISKHS